MSRLAVKKLGLEELVGIATDAGVGRIISWVGVGLRDRFKHERGHLCREEFRSMSS